MSLDARTELRALALWHTRRRAVDDLLGPLLSYGPVAVDRVVERLDGLRSLVEQEQRAFDAFVLAVRGRGEAGAVVLNLFAVPPDTE